MMIFLRNEIDTIVGNEEKETCNRSFIIYYGIAHRLDCFNLDSATYDSGMEYSNEGARLIGRASYEFLYSNYDEAMRLSLYASENFSLAHSKFEEAAEIAKDSPFRVHLAEYIHNFLKDRRARAEAEERANRSLNSSELALAVYEKIGYIKEGKYTKQEWKYLHKEISQLTSSIWANTYTIIGKEEAEK